MTRSLRENSQRLLLLLPPLVVFSVLLILPLGNVVDQSFRVFEGGNIGAAADADLTLFNYSELIKPTYLFYFIQTFRIGFVGSVLAVALAFPIAYLIARMRSQFWRGIASGALIALISVSTLVRVYALLLAFGPVGYGNQLSALIGLGQNSAAYTEIVVLAGLVYFHTPISALVLIGTIQGLNPQLIEAAQSLGASRWKSHLSITIPLCLPGISAAFLISFTVCVSAFVIPMILGKGKVLFVSNLIYNRFSEVANYPSGSAISVVLLSITLFFVVVVPWLFTRVTAGSPG
jgi:ABC-type spermidine/putrescine transport system permease subunit I